MRTNVNFISGGLEIAGHLYIPEDEYDGARPAIVVGHPGTGVKEQAAGLYARRLAEQGFVTLAFDAAYQGESEGLPRGLEDPAQRIEDLKAAVSYLTTREDVGADRIGAVGICASGGYGLVATATDPRIKAFATVSAADIARQFRVGADGTQDPAVFEGLLAAAASARTVEARGDDVQTFELFPADEDAARAGGQHVYEGWEYYCTPRGEHARSTKVLPWVSVDRIATFDAFHAVELISPRPLLMITGRNAVTAWMSVEAFQKARGPKEFTWIENATHVDLYDRDEYVSPAVAKLTTFFDSAIR